MWGTSEGGSGGGSGQGSGGEGGTGKTPKQLSDAIQMLHLEQRRPSEKTADKACCCVTRVA